MARYVTLLRFTEQGAKNIKKSAARARAFKAAAKKAGVVIEGQYWTIGAYDGLLILQADSEDKALHCLTELRSVGAVRTETMQAFVDSEFASIAQR